MPLHIHTTVSQRSMAEDPRRRLGVLSINLKRNSMILQIHTHLICRDMLFAWGQEDAIVVARWRKDTGKHERCTLVQIVHFVWNGQVR